MSTVAMELNRREKTAAAMVEMCSVRLGTALFGVPITHILEIVGSARPQPVPLAPPFVGGLVHYRGDVLTTVSLRQLLGLPGETEVFPGHGDATTIAREKRSNYYLQRLT